MILIENRREWERQYFYRRQELSPDMNKKLRKDKEVNKYESIR